MIASAWFSQEKISADDYIITYSNTSKSCYSSIKSKIVSIRMKKIRSSVDKNSILQVYQGKTTTIKIVIENP